jgi:hypothetical protein
LAWSDELVQPTIPGDCQPEAWEVTSADVDIQPLLEMAETALGQPHQLWQRNLRSVSRRLAGLSQNRAEQERIAGLMFCWLLPWLEAHDLGVPDGLRSRHTEAVESGRVAHLLRRLAGRSR